MITLTFSIRKTSGNQRELWLHVRIFGKLVVSRRVFRCHARQHRVIRDVLCALRFWVWRKPVALIPATVTTPAAKVGATETFKALAEKSRTAAVSAPDKYAKVTEKIMSQPKRKGEFKTPTYKRDLMSDRYGDIMRAVKAEQGI